jgi:hypothetical protein
MDWIHGHSGTTADFHVTVDFVILGGFSMVDMMR